MKYPQDTSTFSGRLKVAIEAKYNSVHAFALANQLAESTVRGYANGTSHPKSRMREKLADLLQISRSWLETGEGPMVVRQPRLRFLLENGTPFQRFSEGADPDLTQAYFNRAEMFFSLGQYPESIQQFRQAVTQARLVGDFSTQVRALTRAARAAIRTNDLAHGLRLISEAQGITSSAITPDLRADTMITLANILFRKGEFDRVKPHLKEALDMVEEKPNPELYRRYWELIACHAHAYEEWEAGINAYEQRTLLEVPYEEQYNLTAWTNHGIMLANVGRFNEAVNILSKVINSINALGESPAYQSFGFMGNWGLGLVYEMQSEWAVALEFYSASLKTSDSPESFIGAAKCMKHLNSPLFDLTLQRGLNLLTQQIPICYMDYTSEWLFLLEHKEETVKPLVKRWVDKMIKITPMSYWDTPTRKRLLKLLST